MEKTSYAPGTPNWVDMGAPDPAAAAAFYGGLFGWEAPEGPPETGGYRMCLLRGQPVAGIGPQQSPDVPPFWATYVSVPSADDTVARVAELGGMVVVPPMDIMDFGRMAVFMDPVGAACSVWEPKQFAGSVLVNEPGAFGWNELVTTDVEASTAFYTELFGWTADVKGEGMPYTEWQVDGRSVGGMMAKPPQMPAEVPPHWAVYFIVDDVDASAAKVTELGGTVLMPPMDIEPGRFAVVMDPGGASFNIMKLKEGLGS